MLWTKREVLCQSRQNCVCVGEWEFPRPRQAFSKIDWDWCGAGECREEREHRSLQKSPLHTLPPQDNSIQDTFIVHRLKWTFRNQTPVSTFAEYNTKWRDLQSSFSNKLGCQLWCPALPFVQILEPSNLLQNKINYPKWTLTTYVSHLTCCFKYNKGIKKEKEMRPEKRSEQPSYKLETHGGIYNPLTQMCSQAVSSLSDISSPPKLWYSRATPSLGDRGVNCLWRAQEAPFEDSDLLISQSGVDFPDKPHLRTLHSTCHQWQVGMSPERMQPTSVYPQFLSLDGVHMILAQVFLVCPGGFKDTEKLWKDITSSLVEKACHHLILLMLMNSMFEKKNAESPSNERRLLWWDSSSSCS